MAISLLVQQVCEFIDAFEETFTTKQKYYSGTFVQVLLQCITVLRRVPLSPAVNTSAPYLWEWEL